MRCILVHISFVFFEATFEANIDGEYLYDEDVMGAIKSSNRSESGSRLIGARSAKAPSEAPFVVAIGRFARPPYEQCLGCVECTGVLISPRIVLSAAHCTEYIKKVNGRHENERCLKATRAGKIYEHLFIKMKCKSIKTQQKGKIITNIEIFPEYGAVYLGVTDMNSAASISRGKFSEIRSVIRHGQSYRGGGTYGKFGGFDITLITLASPLHGHFSCLPGATFQDIAPSKLAGYGNFFRKNMKTNKETCMTNKYGMAKFHYCKSGPEGKCQQGPPPRQSRLCRKFQNKFSEDDVDELMLTRISKTKKENTFCFPLKNKEDPSHGWCWTKGDYYDLHNYREDTTSWGYCSKDCFLSSNEQHFGVLRMVDKVDVLDGKLCDEFLDWSLSRDTKVRPRVLCVGTVTDWNIGHYVDQNGKFRKLKNRRLRDKLERMFHYGRRGRKLDPIIASAGTCSGDSGGPVYQEVFGKKRHFVVTGLVSGGRGRLGNCGGLNNPVHYVRLKKLVPWVMEIMKTMSGEIDGNTELNSMCLK